MGLDLTDLESDHAKIYEARTALNRDVNREAVLFDQMPRHDDAPDALVDIAALTTQLEEIAKHNQEASQASAEVKRGEERLEVMKRDGQALSAKIVGLEAELAAAKKAECEMAETYTFAYRDLEEMRTHLPTPLDDAPVRHKLKAADAVNTRVRENTAKTAAETALGELRAKAQGCTDALVAIEEKKRDRIAAAHFPIDGLGFDDAGPTLNGIPISQASGAQRIRLGVAIAAALNPRLRVVLVRDGSNLDDENLALLAKLAEEHDLQVWVERVSTHDAGAIIITDGEVSDYGKHGDAQPLTTDDI
jgi:hypothetical protein